MHTHRLAQDTVLDAPLDKVFEFFSDAANLEVLTPKTLQFQILSPLPISMHQGTLIDYKLRIRGIPVKWRTEIAVWEPGVRFVDRQIIGPYRQWVHEHRFVAEGSKTRMFDTVDYALPFQPFSELVHAIAIRREIEGIFAFRSEVLNDVVQKLRNRQ